MEGNNVFCKKILKNFKILLNFGQPSSRKATSSCIYRYNSVHWRVYDMFDLKVYENHECVWILNKTKNKLELYRLHTCNGNKFLCLSLKFLIGHKKWVVNIPSFMRTNYLKNSEYKIHNLNINLPFLWYN